MLPVGISFFTFMAISYVVDVYRGDFEPVTLEQFAAYLSFFPHLVAGPIVRPGELLPQMETPRDPRRVDASRAFYLIATGLFKKVVIANYLAAHIIDEVFGAPGQHSSLEILVAIYAYAVQIYADFSGLHRHGDRASRCCSASRFPQNFDSPYAADVAAGLLAPLAHDALALAARLPLHPARREPEGPRCSRTQPDADDAARRALARRGVDVRGLGRHPRHRRSASSAGGAAGPGGRAPSRGAWRIWARRAR